jgi:hypothetical protein
MTSRREFLVTTIAAAASLTNSSGQNSATLSGLSIANETGQKIQHSMTQFQEATT